jgi:hypothetical protein
MAYVADNLWMGVNPVGAQAYPRVFFYYNSAADADAAIVGAGYFSDGVTKGMRVGDLVDAVQTGTAKYKRYQITSVSGAAATASAPTAIT